MANKKISVLNAATYINDADLHVIVQAGETKKIAHDTMMTTDFAEGYAQPPTTPNTTTFSNGWVQSANPLQVRLTGYKNRAIYFSGQLDCSAVTFTPGSFSEVFTLPTAYRPSITLLFPIVGAYEAIGMCSVGSDGVVSVKDVVGDLTVTGIVDFSSVNYYTERD